jgi:hypothetical protein
MRAAHAALKESTREVSLPLHAPSAELEKGALREPLQMMPAPNALEDNFVLLTQMSLATTARKANTELLKGLSAHRVWLGNPRR